jgi:hypothetical protein
MLCRRNTPRTFAALAAKSIRKGRDVRKRIREAKREISGAK